MFRNVEIRVLLSKRRGPLRDILTSRSRRYVEGHVDMLMQAGVERLVYEGKLDNRHLSVKNVLVWCWRQRELTRSNAHTGSPILRDEQNCQTKIVNFLYVVFFLFYYQ